MGVSQMISVLTGKRPGDTGASLGPAKYTPRQRLEHHRCKSRNFKDDKKTTRSKEELSKVLLAL